MIERPTFLDEEERKEAPYRCTLKMDDHGVNYFSKDDFFTKNLLSNPEYCGSFPGWQVSFQPVCGPGVVYVEDQLSALDYLPEKNTLFARGERGDYLDGQAFAYLGFWLLEAQRQKDSIFTLHSSALAIEGRGVLLLGHSGAGKTTVMLEMALNHMAELISNDLTTISNKETPCLINGTKEIRLRLASVSNNFPEWVGLFPDKGKNPWDYKIAFSPEQLGLTSRSGVCPLERIFVVHLDKDTSLPLQGDTVDDISIRYYLYEDMSRIIRGNAISVFGKDKHFLGYTPSLDNVDIHSQRVAMIETMINEIGISSISGGNLSEVCQVIYDRTRG